MNVARLIMRTIAHQWFGNLVSPSWWTQLWLSEGFAHFIQTNIYTKVNISRIFYQIKIFSIINVN